jgi:hypothetical protein
MGRVAFTANLPALAGALAFVNKMPDLREGAWVHQAVLTATPGGHVAVARNNGHAVYHADVADAKPVQAGVAAVSARQLAEALNGMPVHTGRVTVVVDGTTATVTPDVAGAMPVHVTPHDPAEWADRTPDMPEVSTTATVGLASLRDAVRACAKVAAGADLPVLAHVHVQLGRAADGWMRLFATDRYRAARRDVDVIAHEGGFAATVHGAELDAAVEAIGQAGDTVAHVDYARAEHRLVLACGPYRVVLDCLPFGRTGEQYPLTALRRCFRDAEAVDADVVALPVRAVSAAVKRLKSDLRAQARAAGQKRAGMRVVVGLTFANGRVALAAHGDGFAAETSLDCPYTGPQWRVAMAANLLLSSLAALGAPWVRWHVPKPVKGWDQRAVVWEPADGAGEPRVGATHLVMPMRLGDNSPLNGGSGGEETDNDHAGAGSACATEEEQVKFEDRVRVTYIDENGAKDVPFNPWAQEQEPDAGQAQEQEPDADREQELWQRAQTAMEAGDLAGALAAVNGLVELRGEHQVFQDAEGEGQFTLAQLREYLQQEIAKREAAAADAAADAGEPEPEQEPEAKPATARKTATRKTATARKTGTRKAAAKATRKPEPEPEEEPEPAQQAPVVASRPATVAQPAGGQPLVPDEHVPAVIAAVAKTVAELGLPADETQERIAAALAALRITTDTLAAAPGPIAQQAAVPATRHRATVRPATAKRPRATAAGGNVVVDGETLRCTLPAGTRAKAARLEMRSRLAARFGPAFHVQLVRKDDDNPLNTLHVTVDDGSDVADYAKDVKAIFEQVLAAV